MLDKNKALVVFSGGQDSTTCLFWAKTQWPDVRAITFRYGQRHVGEVDNAVALAADADVPITVMDIPFVSQLSTQCSLTNDTIEMDFTKPVDTPPNTFVPGRNLFFLSIAAVFAREHGIMNIVTGVSQTDFSGYPDCRDSFVRSLNVTLNLAMDEQFVLHTPLMWIDKAETWALADRLNVFDLVRRRTITCYNGIPGNGCGHCPSCELRRKGLEEYMERMKKKKEER